MSEPTYSGDAPVRGDWSQVYTGLDWVAQWMADRGYTDAEIAYVVGEPAVPAVTVHVAPVPVEDPALEAVATEQTAWTVPLAVADDGPAEQDDAPADAGDDDWAEPATA